MLAEDYPRDLVALSGWESDTCCDARAVVGKGNEANGAICALGGLDLAFHVTTPEACDITWGTSE